MNLYLNIFAIISLTFLLYTYFIYPFLVYYFSKGKSLVISKTEPLKVAIVLSAYQEESVIFDKLKSILEQNYPRHLLSCWIGSDGSKDKTNEIIELLCSDKSIFHTYFFENRRGKPIVINELVASAKEFYGKEDFILVITDANVIFEKNLINEIVKPFSNNEITVVDSKILPLNYLDNKISITENFYFSNETKLKYNEGLWQGCSMGTSGGCYAIRSRNYKNVPENFLVDDFFISFSSLLDGGKGVLYPNAICYEEVSSSSYVEFKRRRRISAGNFQNLFYFLPLFNFKQFHIWFVFVSHKVVRWLGPFFIIVLLITFFNYLFSNIKECNYLYISILILIGTLLIDKFLENNNIHLRLLKGVIYFLIINLSILIGFFDFIKGIKNNVWEPTKRNQ